MYIFILAIIIYYVIRFYNVLSKNVGQKVSNQLMVPKMVMVVMVVLPQKKIDKVSTLLKLKSETKQVIYFCLILY